MKARAGAQVIVCAVLSTLQIAVSAQPATPIAFDVVSVRANHTMDAHPGPMLRDDGFDAENISLIWVMYWAFGLDMDRDPRHFKNLPSWVTSERFDIIAKVADAEVSAWKKLPNTEKQHIVLGVMQDRFKLSFHRESHEGPVYALIVAKSGLKMRPAVVPESDHVYGQYGYVGPDYGGVGGRHASVKALVDYLNGLQLGREVIDRTGLSGNYDFMLHFTAFPMGSSSEDAATPSGATYPYIFTALEEQLGLKLEPAHGPVDTIVIDHMDRPSEN